MAELIVDGDALVVHLGWWERAVVRRRQVRVPLEAVSRIRIRPDPWQAVRGVRERGLLVPGVLCVGVWRHLGGRDFVSVRLHQNAAVCVELRDPAPFARIVATPAYPQQTVAALRTAESRAAAADAQAQIYGTGRGNPGRPVRVPPRGRLQPV
ncbi:hypothetical protein [Kitasatospora sp. NPDC085879]|uniref:hypothetical protein n=1 Tax=Kitasatospora sp. NPDC085879 TaxID=3154769 RepID=UPI000BB11DE2|nr:hypothetical protein [Streptomyces sp. TLI_235]PBC69972.1 hypothetical protein BX265_7353 [Streptomyces sp. TLI_235]